ncbi:MAG: hypothetical protein J6D45_00375 [Clostridia bacterium]|nr:hypothetical protein [Clostridia bacterium]
MKKKVSFKEMTKQSNILMMIRRISAYIVSAFHRSFIGGVIVSDLKEEKLFDEGVTKSILNGQAKRNSPIKKVRHFISSEFERSRVFSIVQRLYQLFFTIKMRSIGLFILSYAIFASLAIVIQYYPFDSGEWLSQTFTVFALIIVSLPFIFSRRNIAETMKNSKMFSSVIAEALGVDFDQKIRDIKNIRLNPKYSGLAPVLGIACGALSVYLPPIVFVALAVTVLFAAFILSKPEVGVVLIIFAVPFSDILLLYKVDILTFLIFTTAFGYAGKLLLGRREFVVDFLDVFMLIALVTVASCCIGNSGAGEYGEIRRICMFMCAYFLFVNLIKTRGWFFRASNALVFSLCVILFIGVLLPLLGRIPYVRDVVPSEDMLERIYLFGSPSEAIYMLIPALTFLMAAVAGSKPGRRATYSAYLFLAAACLVFGGNPIAFPAIITAVVVYVLCLSPSAVFVIIPLFMLNIALTGLDIPIISNIMAEGEEFATQTLAENLNIAYGSMRALGDYWLTGIGFGSDSFSKIYPNYAYAGFENASDAGISAIGLLLGFGIFGIIVIASAVIFFIRETFGRIIRIDDRKDKAFLAASVSSICGYIVALFCDNAFAVDTVTLYVFIIMAVSSSYMRIIGNEDRRRAIQHPDTPDHVDMIIPAKSKKQ